MPSVSPTIRVKVLFFGRLKEIVSCAEECLDFAATTDIESLFAQYACRFPLLQEYRSSTVVSRNQEFVPWHSHLSSGDEVAFLPPVSGG